MIGGPLYRLQHPRAVVLFKHINGTVWDSASIEMTAKSPEEAYLNKTHAGEVAVAVDDITKRIMRDITVENLFNLNMCCFNLISIVVFIIAKKRNYFFYFH